MIAFKTPALVGGLRRCADEHILHRRDCDVSQEYGCRRCRARSGYPRSRHGLGNRRIPRGSSLGLSRLPRPPQVPWRGPRLAWPPLPTAGVRRLLAVDRNSLWSCEDLGLPLRAGTALLRPAPGSRTARGGPSMLRPAGNDVPLTRGRLSDLRVRRRQVPSGVEQLSLHQPA